MSETAAFTDRAAGNLETDVSNRIRAERISMVYGNTGYAILGNILVAFLAGAIVFPQTPALASGAWLSIFLLIIATRWGIKLAYDRQTAADQHASPDLWAKRLLMVVTIHGAWWGAFCLLLLASPNPLPISFAPFIIGGMAAAAVATLCPLRAAYFGFTLPMVALLIGALVWRGDPDSMIMAGFTIAFEITMLGTAWRVNEIVGRNIELTLQNDGLIRSLTAANAKFAEANQHLEHEIDERKRAEERSEFLATHDVLTGLPNRRMQNDRFAQAAARVARSGGSAAILFIDLDNFKGVNDRLGHAAGDLLLRTLSGRLRDCLRQGDSVCRHGGDEFLLLISDAADQAAVANVAERIIASMREPVEVANTWIQVGCSIGIGLYPGDGDDFDLLVSRADKALYQAKRQGRGRYRFFSRELNATNGLDT